MYSIFGGKAQRPNPTSTAPTPFGDDGPYKNDSPPNKVYAITAPSSFNSQALVFKPSAMP